MANHRRQFDEQEFRLATQNHPTMAKAADSLGIPFNTFKRHAKRLGLYSPNAGAKGTKKPKDEGKDRFFLKDILNGKHPSYSSNRLKTRLIEEGLKEPLCEQCGRKEWLGDTIPLELHHKDGHHTNHSFDNLMIVCPNCHAMSHRNALREKRTPVTDEEIRVALREVNGNIHQAVLRLKLPVTGSSYDRIRKVLDH